MKISRNDPCPCGSGEKYKKCCLAKQAGMAAPARMQEIMDEIRVGVESQEFFSLEEAQAALNQLTQKQNNGPLAAFHGLSPFQIHRILQSVHRGFFGNKHFSKAKAYLQNQAKSPINRELPPLNAVNNNPAEKGIGA